MFMYLHLRIDGDHVIAEVKNSGELTFSSIGGPNSQRSDYPFSVIRISEFTGLSAISTEDLLAEILRRHGHMDAIVRRLINGDDLILWLQRNLSDKQLIELVSSLLEGRLEQ